MSDLQIQNISKSYRTSSSSDVVRALDDVSLSVKTGEFVALHGASGSGKSTLLYTIAGLVTPDSGKIHLGDTELTKLSSGVRTEQRRQSIGLVFQDFRLVPYLSVLGNVTLMNGDAARAEELLKSMQMMDRLLHKPSQLSAGEQQRCAVARALVHQPLLILADEPTGNLDAENSAIILNYLADYAKQGNMVIMASHDPVAVAAADRSFGMVDGKIQS